LYNLVSVSRLITLPDRGVLVAATDLHGNLADFRTVVARFLDLDDAYLVICGDLVHGPAYAPDDWPAHLGEYYSDESAALLWEAWRLQQRYEGRVHYLLGNHEHAHVGGPRLAKFHPDEARYLEDRVGAIEFERFRQWMRGWPLVAAAPHAGIVLTHAAPHAEISAVTDLDVAPLDGYEHLALHDMANSGPVGALLWARTTTAERARAFLRVFGAGCRVSVYGHDIVREGHLVEHEPLLCVSSSFGCFDGDKVYLQWDLATSAASAHEVARLGLRRLYPNAPPTYRASSRGSDA
jgi:hypothetical protein